MRTGRKLPRRGKARQAQVPRFREFAAAARRSGISVFAPETGRPSLGPLHPLVELAQAALVRHRLWPERGPLVVAVSGGLDSVVLLRVLAQLSPAAGVPLVVAHANHGLRNETDMEASFVANVAEQLTLPFVSERLPVREAASQSRESVEMTGRRLRHAFLVRAAEAQQAQRIALAHHAGDQAELFLLRLLRGAGGAGLGGMRTCSPSPADPRFELVRPFLDAPRELLRDYAASHSIDHCEDASNADVRIPRNRIRHELLPQLRCEYSPAIDTLLLRTGDLLGAEAEFVRDEARRWLRAKRRRSFGQLAVALQRAIIREQLWALGHAADFELVERLRLHPGSVSASREKTVRLNAGRVEVSAGRAAEFSSAELRVSLAAHSGQFQFGGVPVTWSRTRSSAPPPRRPVPGREIFDATIVGPEITLRHWRRGDRFRPLGLSRAVKLQDVFINRKIPADQRRGLVVATTLAGEIFWVEGLPPGEAFKVGPATTERLTLRWRRDS
jgi:tRNA(Ile)-lysidine synthase